MAECIVVDDFIHAWSEEALATVAESKTLDMMLVTVDVEECLPLAYIP